MKEEIWALIIKRPFINLILEGKKTWELRKSNTKIRGLIALISKGKLYGFVNLTNTFRIKVSELKAFEHMHRAGRILKRYAGGREELYVWVLSSPLRLPKPIKVTYPRGVRMWTKLKVKKIIRKLRAEGLNDLAMELELRVSEQDS